jgi:hypothetical protein
LTISAFLVLRERFFEASMQPRPFVLRDKRNTQDDPFDEHVAGVLADAIPNATCVKATGPLITPDMVLMSNALPEQVRRNALADDLTFMVGIEVKKLDRTRAGQVARASGLDYNTTPPCGTIRVYDATRSPVDIRGFYLFVCLEQVPQQPGSLVMTAMALCDGNLLNADCEYYLSIVGARQKAIHLGTYGDGMDRTRPMVVFPNPLGAKELDHRVTLVHADGELAQQESALKKIYRIWRTLPGGTRTEFSGYCLAPDVPPDWVVQDLTDPFPTPARKTATAPRGRFRLPLRLGA